MSITQKIRGLIIFFMIGSITSGLTAFPVESELLWLLTHNSLIPAFMMDWLQTCYDALKTTNANYPMLAYGYDWLGFAHIIIAMAFIGPLKNPVRNVWVIEWGIASCIAVIPMAFIAGPIRYIPFFHILIDCSFGLIGIIPLLICRNLIKKIS
ncbi:MAG: hypothetical protein ABIT58_03715 [Ferruginibacter sp.]